MFEEFKKIEIIDKIITICENQVELHHANIDESDRYVKITGTCFLVKNYESCYNELVGTIFRELKLGGTFSSDYVRQFIDSLISETLKIGVENVKEDKLIIDIFDDHFQEVIVYIPLDGIELEVETLKIGKITLRKMNLQTVNEIADKLVTLLRNNPYYNPDDIEKSLAFQRKLILRFKDKICAEFTLFAEEDIAIRTGFEECSRSLDLLNRVSDLVRKFTSYLTLISHTNDYLNFPDKSTIEYSSYIKNRP